MRRLTTQSVTLVELVVVLAVGGLIAIMAPSLVSHGTSTLIYLPNALATNHVATEVLHQMTEGGFSTLPGQPTIRGLRFAMRSGSQPAIWDPSPSRVGFRTSDNRCVLIELSSGLMTRRAAPVSPGSPCPPLSGPETLPAEIPAGVQIVAASGSVFRYYNQSGVEVFALPIRRVDITFFAQTGGNIEQGEARERVSTSVAIRVP